MALEHLIAKTSIGEDGQSLVLQDETVGYGQSGNPFRTALAWLVSAERLDGACAEPVAVAVSYLRNDGTAETPAYTPADPLTATHILVPIAQTGHYVIKSVLVPRRSTLSPETGVLALNGLYADDDTFLLKRVTEAHLLSEGDETTPPTYSYLTEELAGIEPALKAGLPALLFPVLQLLRLRQALAMGNHSYLVAGGVAPCSVTGQGGHKAPACPTRGEGYHEIRELCQDLQYQLMGAEANFACGLYEKLYINLREAGFLAEALNDL